MAEKNLRVVVTRRLPEGIERELSERFHAELNRDDTPMDAARMKAVIAEADVLVPTVTDRLGPEIIAAAGPQLRLIANFGVGFNHIDVKAAAARNIAVTN